MSEIALSDSEFWNKHISRYEQTISCYDKYPSISNLSEKADLRDQLAKLQENSRSSKKNSAEYRANIAQANIELTRNLAKIEEENKAWDAELLRRTQERQEQSAEREAEYVKQQAERDRQAAVAEIQRQQQEQTAKSKDHGRNTLYEGNIRKASVLPGELIEPGYSTEASSLNLAQQPEIEI